MKYNCLIIDDEIDLAAATCEYFNMFGVSAEYVTNSKDCMIFLHYNQVQLILLDINLQNESGFTLCKELRKTLTIPILFISARQSDDDILIALNIGGDDYIKKPYSLSVLLAKVKVILKRFDGLPTDHIDEKEESDITININARKLYVNGEEILLKNKEFKLFVYLYHNRNRVVSKEELFTNVWGDEFFSDGTLNVHIRKIREKIEENPTDPKYIKTIWGIGYMLEL
jgi:two-component system response regulator RegX3